MTKKEKEMKLKTINLIISFKKYLRSVSGQTILEYFLLFTVIALFTVIGLSTFFPKVQASFNEVQNAAIERIIHADGN